MQNFGFDVGRFKLNILFPTWEENISPWESYLVWCYENIAYLIRQN